MSKNNPVNYEFATKDPNSSKKPDENKYYGFGVDSGTASIYDAKFAEELLSSFEFDEDDFYQRLVTELDKNYVHTRGWGEIQVGLNNLIGFSSGWGDGYYYVFWGLDDDNQPTSILIDFDILPKDTINN